MIRNKPVCKNYKEIIVIESSGKLYCVDTYLIEELQF